MTEQWTPEQLQQHTRESGATEHDEQCRLVAWARGPGRLVYPELRLLFAIPNGGKRNIIIARKLRAEGVAPGVPDMLLPVPRGAYAGLFLEMKAPGGGKGRKGRVRDLQEQWHGELRHQGYAVEVAWGYLHAKEIVEKYLRREA